MNNLNAQFTQQILSELWVKPGGQGIAVKSTTTTDANRNVYVAGSTLVGPNNCDIIIQKFQPDGVLDWQQTYAGLANLNDFASAIYVDGNSDVYVTGSVVNTVSNGQDIIVLKYDQSGVLQWTYTNHGSNVNIDDAGSGITGDPASSDIFVTGLSGDDINLYDYKTFSLTSSGNLQWMETYDFNSLIEIPKKIFVEAGNVIVTGASQDNATHWEIATIQYNINSGAMVASARTNSSSVAGIDEINDVTIDPLGNLYLVGALQNGNGDYDVAVYKLDTNLTLIWENYYDINGLDDKGTGIEFLAGDIYLTGYSTKDSLGEEILLMKLNANGVVQWQKEFGGTSGGNDRGKKLVLDQSGRIYVASAINDGNNLDFGLFCFDGNGNILATTSFNGGDNLNDVPESINLDLDNNIIVTGTEQLLSGELLTKTIKYNFYDRNYSYEYVGGKPVHLKGTILIRFKAENMLAPTMNSRKHQGGLLSDFVDNATISAMQMKTGHDWSKFHTFKVLKNTTPEDSISITRLGDTIKADDLWTYLSVDIPSNTNHKVLCDSLKTLYGFIRDADLDILFELHSSASDLYYGTGQLGLFPNSTYLNADINVEDAWDLEVGQFNVKVGVMDAVVHWDHEEFNGNVAYLPGPTEKIGGGYNYMVGGSIIYDLNQLYDHGTKVAGIIGAKRNNFLVPGFPDAIGVAGIAGGDNTFGVNNRGVQLFPQVVFNSNGTNIYSFASMSVIGNAISEGSSNSPSNPNHFGLNLINASWGTIPGGQGSGIYHTFLKAGLKECWRNHCVFIASRGSHNINIGEANIDVYPACGDDKYLINVMSSGNNGNLNKQMSGNGDNFTSNSGMDGNNNTAFCPADLMAPGTVGLVSTTAIGNTYSTFSHTSAATAHVTGVAALMYSKHNIANNYSNNLTTEDIEAIMQKTASNQGMFSWESGYGLLNAFESVNQVSDPYYVKHLTAIPTVTNAGTVNVDIYTSGLVYPYGSYPNSTKYIVDWDINETLPNGHQIIDWWEVEALTYKGLNYTTSANINLLPGEVVNVSMIGNPIGSNTVHRTAQMATYLINAPSPNSDFWYPMSPQELKYYFSIHVLKAADASLTELKTNNFELYPNPAETNIIVKAKGSGEIEKYQIVDVSGRVLTSSQNISQGNEISIDISKLSSGVYYFNVYSNGLIENLTFVKI